MPIPRKEKKDEVKKLIEEGYNNVEIAEKTGLSKGTVSKWRTELSRNQIEETQSDVKGGGPSVGYLPVSGDSLKKLHDLQGLFGHSTLDDTIDMLHKEMPRIMAQAFRVNMDFHGGPGEAFEMLAERERLLREATDLRTKNPDAQGRVLALMGMSWFPKGIYNRENHGESIVQFLENKLLEHYLDKKWYFYRKNKELLLRLHPKLEGELTGDLLSICEPEPYLSFPKKNEDYFGVQTEPISIEMMSAAV